MLADLSLVRERCKKSSPRGSVTSPENKIEQKHGRERSELLTWMRRASDVAITLIPSP